MTTFANVSLIGMPGVGKSTVGVLLAKALSWNFLDTDVMIQVAEERTVREIIQMEGVEAFARTEQRHVVALDRRKTVIAAGASVINGLAAMGRLKILGAIVHLDLPLSALEVRLANLNGRSVPLAPGQTLQGIYQQRRSSYHKYADIVVHCDYRSQEQIVDEIIARLA